VKYPGWAACDASAPAVKMTLKPAVGNDGSGGIMKEKRYVPAKDDNGVDFFCPAGAVEENRKMAGEALDDCVEQDVVGRYPGNR
jgi:hypothetical protein